MFETNYSTTPMSFQGSITHYSTTKLKIERMPFYLLDHHIYNDSIFITIAFATDMHTWSRDREYAEVFIFWSSSWKPQP